jgi:hypothetical protein
VIRFVTAIRFAVAVTALLTHASVCAGADSPPAQVGRSIYREGILPSGEFLRARREGGAIVQGADAACVNCHRRSGLGAEEGRSFIPPIAGPYLFRPRAATGQAVDLPFVQGMRGDRDPYTDATLARAIREGLGADGRQFSYLMPHYAVDNTAMAALIGYLKQLPTRPSPGVTDKVLHFATIITPDADPVKRQGMLSVLRQYFTDKNAAVRTESPALHSSRPMMFRVLRQWQLHVWELTGLPDTWEKQLQAKLAAEPVFAVISGIGGRTWAPIQHFCEQQSLPCLFPNVELPVDAERDFYAVYFSRGVLLEAQLIARRLGAQTGEAQPRRLLQIFRTGDVGEAAAAALKSEVKTGWLTIDRSLGKDDGTGRDVLAAVRDVTSADTVVFWLRPTDLAALASVRPETPSVFLSGLMGGLESAPLPAAWRTAAAMTYGFDLPGARRVRLDYPIGWFRIRQIPVVSLQVQSDTYLACGLLAETLKHMVDAFVRDYLVERLEAMLEHRVITGYYPRLTLAPGQRFASKGGYLVRFAEPTGTRIVADGDWTVP